MLADRNHPDVADRTGANLTHKPRHRRHVAILQPDPDDLVDASRRLDDALTVGDGRTERLLDQDVDSDFEHVEDHIGMGHVRSGDHHGVTRARREERPVVVEHRNRCSVFTATGVERVEALANRRLVWIRERRDVRTREGHQVAEVFLTHHPAADDPVSNVVRHRRDRVKFLPRLLLDGPVEASNAARSAARRWPREWSR